MIQCTPGMAKLPLIKASYVTKERRCTNLALLDDGSIKRPNVNCLSFIEAHELGLAGYAVNT